MEGELGGERLGGGEGVGRREITKESLWLVGETGRQDGDHCFLIY